MTSQGRRSDDPSRLRVALILAMFVVVLAPLALRLAGPPGGVSFARALARGTALAAAAIAVLQVALSARLRALDRAFGHDVVLMFHRWAGLFLPLLVVAHPTLLCIDEGDLSLLSLDVGWRISGGKIALLAFVGGAAAMNLTRLDYLQRRRVHGALVAVGLLLALGHGGVMGYESWGGPLRLCWGGLFVAWVALRAYRLAYVPRWVRRRYRVASVRQETYDTWTVRLVPESEPLAPHRAGQFMFLQLHVSGRSEEHPFTIASAPDPSGIVEATIKASGDFTRGMREVKPGSPALLEGPFGRFGADPSSPSSFLFIAGGVGITPIMSMLRSLRAQDDPRPAVLLYGNKTQADIIFREELEAMAERVKVVHVLSGHEPGWDGPRGYITDRFLRDHASELLDTADVFLCGPPLMMRSVIRALRSCGVSLRRIHYERFAL